MERTQLGNFEFEVLATLIRERNEVYGAHISKLLADAGRSSSVGALYTTLERLEKKGFVSSRWGEPTPERGGRRKRYYVISASGVAALNRTNSHRSRFAIGVPSLQGV